MHEVRAAEAERIEGAGREAVRRGVRVLEQEPAQPREEGGVAVELEFPDAECVRRFQQRIAKLRVPVEEDDASEGD